MYGSCEDGLAVPYQPFVEALRQVLAGATRPNLGPHPEELTRIVPEISDRVPGLSEPTSSDPETERYQLFNAVVDWLIALAADDPVVFVIDDLHWATKPTLHLLQHVVRSRPQAPVLVLVTFRDTEIDSDHPLRDALADLQRSDDVERISLGGLDVDAVRDYIVQLADHQLDQRADVLAERLHTETSGNPFFMREVLLHLAEDGHLYGEDGRWTVGTELPHRGSGRARAT